MKVISHMATFLLRIKVLGNSAFDQRIEASSPAKEEISQFGKDFLERRIR